MTARITLILFLACLTCGFAQQKESTKTKALRNSIETKERAIRQDVPMTNSIRKAYKDGTRDFSGKPGPNYWQLKTDYTIQASINPSTQILAGSEKIEVYNNSK